MILVCCNYGIEFSSIVFWYQEGEKKHVERTLHSLSKFFFSSERNVYTVGIKIRGTRKKERENKRKKNNNNNKIHELRIIVRKIFIAFHSGNSSLKLLSPKQYVHIPIERSTLSVNWLSSSSSTRNDLTNPINHIAGEEYKSLNSVSSFLCGVLSLFPSLFLTLWKHSGRIFICVLSRSLLKLEETARVILPSSRLACSCRTCTVSIININFPITGFLFADKSAPF